MANRKIVHHRETVSGRTFDLYGDPDKLELYVLGLTPVASVPETYTTVGVDSHTVKRYPGDPGYNRPGHNRSVGSQPLRNGSTVTPGKRVWFERTTGIAPLVVTTSHQATYTGSWRALKEFCIANCVATFVRRRESGGSIDIEEAAGP